jgi:hypothetical protein
MMRKKVINWTPDQELIDFANYFSSKYKSLKFGNYRSNQGNYIIKYFPDGIIAAHSERKVSSPARINIITGEIQMSGKINTSDFAYFLIMWCIAKSYKNVQGNMEADTLAFEHYINTGRSKKNILVGMAKMYAAIDYSPEDSKKRLENIMDLCQIKE